MLELVVLVDELAIRDTSRPHGVCPTVLHLPVSTWRKNAYDMRRASVDEPSRPPRNHAQDTESSIVRVHNCEVVDILVSTLCPPCQRACRKKKDEAADRCPPPLSQMTSLHPPGSILRRRSLALTSLSLSVAKRASLLHSAVIQGLGFLWENHNLDTRYPSTCS